MSSVLQAERYLALRALTRRQDLDCSYHAAFYLLSCDAGLFQVACKHVCVYGIGFAGIKKDCRGFDEKTLQVLDIAHNLFSWNSKVKTTPFDISRLGYPLMEQVCNAIYIASGEVKVQIKENEKHKPEIVLDASPYQSTKRIHGRLEQMQEQLLVEETTWDGEDYGEER